MGGRPEDSFRGTGFFVPCIFLLVQAPQHEIGELRELVKAFGFPRQVEALTWVLGQLGQGSLIQATSPPDGDDHPRWCYELTVDGQRWLEARSETLTESAWSVQRSLVCYATAKMLDTDTSRLTAEDPLPMAESARRGREDTR